MGRAVNHQHSEPSDWGDRAVRWLKVYYGDRPKKAIAYLDKILTNAWGDERK